ncbi:unnamed protein product [Kuraishia capsulata CBS 1993]|uniref:FAR-17a/AIG1-like protein n=1 Tax=Kuraishia capsulata CBS 1993 TaxID=1382522 RepID=W6MWA6_9ASCO|nr:uncharacterized protein KUCA_T00003087001 [Kuraishia capsulata CBS 1993]CDK27110.1 unnamed protein product [Kuraishia capsulata CBS 1993]
MKKQLTNRSLDNPYAFLLQCVNLLVGSRAMLAISTIRLPPGLAKAGHWVFLTNLSLFITVAYNVLTIVTYASRSTKLFELHRYLHLIATVLELTVSTVYWPLRLWFLHLIAAKGVGIPMSLDLSIHAMPALTLLLDFYLFLPNWNISKRNALALVTTLAYSYWFWLYIKMDETSIYPYPFLNVSTGKRAVIFVVVALVAFTHFLIHRLIHSRLVKAKKIRKD